MCGDSRPDLNYPEIPNNWNDEEITTMANFNEKINFGTGFVLCDPDNYFIYRSDSMRMFARKIYNDLHSCDDSYRLIIQYKTTHSVKRMAVHCFMWSCESANSGNVDVRMLDRKEDCEDIGDPRLDSIEGAIFIKDRYVYMYGDTWLDAVTLNKEYVVCDAFVCGRLGGTFRIPAEVFDRFFGLKENFPIQYDEIFGKTEEATPVQEETQQSKKIYDAYEIACLMDSNRLCSDLVSSLIRLIGGTNSHYVIKDIYEKSQVARKAVEDLAIELGISIRNIEDGLK